MTEPIGSRPSSPWGQEPPPTPPAASRREIVRVRRAWSAWGPFRPTYTRTGDTVEAEINLKDRIWRGTAAGSDDAQAAWAALQACIDDWLTDIGYRVRLPRLRWWRRG